MNPTSVTQTEGPARTAIRDQVDLHEARLWDRARLNLMLLYGGRRGGLGCGQGNAASGGGTRFGRGELELCASCRG
jgi:hypothetical protein